MNYQVAETAITWIPQGPKYPMGVYLDELRVMEIFEGSPAEKAAESWVESTDLVCRERFNIGNFQSLFFWFIQGETKMYHHSCMIVWCFILFYEFWRVWGDLFVTCWWWHRTSYRLLKTMPGRHSDWGHSSEGEWCGDYDPRGLLKSWWKNTPPGNSHRHTQINYIHIYIHNMSYLELRNIFKSALEGDIFNICIYFQDDRKSEIIEVAGLTASRHLKLMSHHFSEDVSPPTCFFMH